MNTILPAAWITASLFLAPATAQQAAAAPEKPLNIILFLVDDMGWSDSTPYGSTYYETPHLERFAAQSLLFTDAYALPICSPTRASILTGQHASRHGITDATGHLHPRPGGFQPFPDKTKEFLPLRLPNARHFLDASQYTIAEALQDAGYRTALIGKWHLGRTQPHWPETHGFDVAWHSEPSAGPPGLYFSPYLVFPPEEAPAPGEMPDAGIGTITDGPDGEYITDRLTEEALHFIDECEGQPFFLNMWHFGVHSPWGHKPEYTETFVDKKDPSGRQGNPIMASMLKSVDDSLGRLMDALDERDLTDSTVVLFYSDNGGNVHSNLPGRRRDAQMKTEGGRRIIEAYQKWAGDLPPTSNLPLRAGKGSLYEGGQRVPLVVRWPGETEAGTRTDAIVSAIDLYPTFLEMAGVAPSPKQTLDGRSFVPVLQGKDSSGHNSFYSWSPHGNAGASVRIGDWKLIRRLRPYGAFPGLRELYNLKEDLGELQNLAARFPDRTRALDEALDTFLGETGALYPPPNPMFLGQDMRPSARGLVADQCLMTPIEDGIRLTAIGGDALLSSALVETDAPMTLTLRIRSAQGGRASVAWSNCLQPGPRLPDRTAAFEVPAGQDWQELDVALPVESLANTLRFSFSLEGSPWELQSVAFRDTATGAPVYGWDLKE